MIVTLHPCMIDNHPNVDTNMRIKVLTHKSSDTIYRVRGNQLLIAGVRSVGCMPVEPKHTYVIFKSSTVPVCYDTVKLNENVPASIMPDRTYQMRVQGYDSDGYVLLLISDLKKCMIVRSVAMFRSPEREDCIAVKPSMVRFV